MEIEVDFLIVGSGIAALRAAVELADAGEILILTKAEPGEGSTRYAQGGIAAAVGTDDSPERHAADTISAGDGLCDESAVRILVEEGPRYVRELIEWGAEFDRESSGQLELAMEGGHGVRRVLHARDATGREVCRVLWQRISHHSRIHVLEHALVTDAIIPESRCTGMHYRDRTGHSRTAPARATLLATGGAGQVYRETTTPAVVTGDGIAIAYRAGARVTDLEFVQFHPTALNSPGAPRFLLSEALRGEGARLINEAGEAFMTRYDAAGDLAPRDRVARGIAREADRTRAPVYLMLDHLAYDFVHRRFPFISGVCRQVGLDLARDRIPLSPAAHYVMGGVETSSGGHTSIPGLFAAGEVACTGMHGANRLASNSLLEGLVFGARAGAAMKQWVADGCKTWPQTTTRPRSAYPRAGRIPASVPEPSFPEAEVRDLMWRLVGLFREQVGLEQALARLDAAWNECEAVLDSGAPLGHAAMRTVSLVTVGRLITRGALRRHESRGAHFRADFPDHDELHWRHHVSETCFEDGR